MPPTPGAPMHQPPEIVCVGLATSDLIVEVPRWPDPDGRMVVGPFRRSNGGPAATAAVAAARLGRSVAFAGAVGDDEAGLAAREALAREGVDVTYLSARSGSTAESVIMLDAAARSIIHAPGAVLEGLAPDVAGFVAAGSWIHVDHVGWPLVSDVARDRMSVDAGNPVDALQLNSLGLFAPTKAALEMRYPGQDLAAGLRSGLAEGAARVAVTLGAEGAVAADPSGAWRVRPPDVHVRSTLGAGDVFHGALVAMLSGGHALPDALRAATVAAALSCRGLDGREAIPTADELDRAMRSAPRSERILLDTPA